MTAIETKARAARAAANRLASVDTATKNQVLRDLAAALATRRDEVFAANRADMDAARAAGLPGPKLRRLEITPQGLDQMIAGLRQVADLPDPVGAVVKEYTTPSGLAVRKVRVPLGVIAMIYEARPNVTIDAFALCFKAGNACFLKGGREAAHSNALLADAARAVLHDHHLPEAAVEVITSSDRDEMRHLLTLSEYIDLVIPRGGTELIRFVHEHARMPMVQHFHGVCHVYVDEFADRDKALAICVTGKTSAPATCNATECVLVHQACAADLIPELVQRYTTAGVEVRGDDAVRKLAPEAHAAADDDWGHEFLDMIVALKVVPDADAAIAHIQRYGSNHTDAIISENPDRQARFIAGVGSSCVLTNASTRFNDGFQLGLGAEIGISTSKIHAYGPMGLEELTTQRYVVTGSGQTR
ncbi:MAG TPA: glutamate-5-semialdehyde dehydrogenase [Phycisphaerae bacterium]|nr:glutamate-5-semialdehyde dehydrogenase [Phycisphaerales bacterium]HRX83506.1 glutamate-5-semialdehyde dehydrogenase [Phycisphaerae bacterium]